MEGGVFRYTSPMLVSQGEDMLYECPVGKILRESPLTYDIIDAVSLAENATPTDKARMPRFFWQAANLVQSERARLMELEDSEKATANDAKYGAEAIRRRRVG